MSKDFVEIIDDDGHHYVYKGDIGPYQLNRRECYLCGSRRHWTMDCPRKDFQPQPFIASKSGVKLNMGEWQPIETAPLDGTEVLVIGTLHNMLIPNPRRHVATYRHGWWCNRRILSHVTHWMPLPSSPQQKADGKD